MAVVGSLNLDITARVETLPAPGETVIGSSHFTGLGGKGANQAVAVARLGRDVAIVGRVGDDDAGHSTAAALRGEGVDVSHLQIDPQLGTGLAFIFLDSRGENSIVVSPGANAAMTTADVEAAARILEDAAVTLVQLEVPMDVVARTVELAGGLVVLNPAPFQPLPDEVLTSVDVLVPNRVELAGLAGSGAPPEVATQAASIAGPDTLVVTLGAEGALIADRAGSRRVPAPEVVAVDTVGAGDSFCGALADGLAGGVSIDEAVAWAATAGAITATREGAQAALPTRDEVAALMREQS